MDPLGKTAISTEYSTTLIARVPKSHEAKVGFKVPSRLCEFPPELLQAFL